MKIVLEQYMQDIIMASKGYYNGDENETRYDKMKRIISSINGCDVEYFGIDTVNTWLFRVWEALLKINDSCVCMYKLQKLFTGDYFFFENKSEDIKMNYFDFLLSEISVCRVKHNDYELVLTLNNDLATIDDKVRDIERDYEYIRPELDGNKPYIFKAMKDNKVIATVIECDDWIIGASKIEKVVEDLIRIELMINS